MIPRSRFAVLAAGLVLLNVACLLWIRYESLGRGQPRVRVLSVLPVDDLDRAERISLLFDEPIGSISPDDPVQSPPFTIEPPPDGHWTWGSPDRLDFVLARPLPPGRVFTIRPAIDLEARTGRALVGPREYRLRTSPLAMEGCTAHSADREAFTLELRFNQPVAPAALLAHLQVKDTDRWELLPVTCLTAEPERTLVVRCSSPPQDQVYVRVGADLTGADGELPLGEDQEQVIQLPRTFCLLRARRWPADLERHITVYLEFSRELDRKQPPPSVKLDPPVEGLQIRPSHDEITLEGLFECGRRYTATVGPDVRSAGGERLGAEQTLTFDVPERNPGIAFPFRQGTLMPGGNLQLDLRAVNIAGLKLQASRVHANNLAAHVRGDDPDITARQVREKTVSLALPRNVVSDMALDLRDLLGTSSGVFHVCAAATDQAWTSDTAIVTVSNLGITAKQEQDGYLVWLTSVRSAAPVAGVQVAAITRNNQTLATGQTGPDGTVRLAVPPDHPDGPVWLITAQAGDDLNFLVPDEHPWVLDDVDQSGPAYPETYDVLLYTERRIYRPGDTVHLTGLIRDAAGHVPPPFPLGIAVKRPDGRKVTDLTATPAADRQGFFHAAYTTDADGQLGPYDFTVSLPGADGVLGQTGALVEEYVPARMEMHVEPTQPRYRPGQVPTLQVRARYLFDQPAAGLPVKASGSLRRAPFASARYARYTFADPDDGKEQDIAEVKGELDAAGQALLEIPLDVKDPGFWQATLLADITEPGGRTMARQATVDVDTADRHIGLLPPDSRLPIAGQPITIHWVQLSGADELAEPSPLTFALDRVERDMTIEQVAGRLVWKTTEHLAAVDKGNIEPAGQATGTLQVTCPSPGHHRLVITDSRTGKRTQLDLHAAAEGSGRLQIAGNEPDRLEIILDREQYAPGSQAKVVVRSPFAGSLLLTLETDRVLARRIVQMDEMTAELSLPVTDELRGGAFVTATVIRPVDPDKDKWLPHRAIGMARLAVDHKNHALPVMIDAPTRTEPGSRVSVTVKTEPPADASRPTCVHIWAVDEGILQTVDYRTPDPLAHFFAARQAAVASADALADLLPDYKRPASMTRIGADGEEDSAFRRSLVPAPRREPAIVWHTVTTVSADGSATVELALPDLTGEMRIMAVAADQDRYGAAEQPLTLTAPLLVEMSWPRFAAPGDRFTVPAKIFNATQAPLDVNLSLPTVTGPIEVRLPGSPTLTVQPGQPVTLWLQATATGMGQACVELAATTPAPDDDGVAMVPALFDVRAGILPAERRMLVAKARADLPIRPAAALHRTVRLLRAPASQPVTIPVPDGYLPGTVRATISVGARPTVQLLPAMQQLIDYPYGCVEQTTSRLLALLHLPDLLATSGAQDSRAQEIGNLIDAGVARLWSMQTRSGGLSYWPGQAGDDLWGSTYAAAFLLQASQAGYRVSPQLTNPLLDYLDRTLQSRADQLDANMRTRLCAVLAGFGKPPHNWMDRLSERVDLLDTAARADLAAAQVAIGRKDRALAALPDDTMQQTAAISTSGRLTSQVAQSARLLHVLLDLDPDHLWIPMLVQQLNQARSDGQWGSTLDSASALAALARYELRAPKDDCDFSGTIRCGQADLATFSHATPATCRIDKVSDPIEITTAGIGEIHVSVIFQGLLAQDQVLPYDRQLTVQRRWLDPKGNEVDPAGLKVGDLVHVEITLASPTLGGDETLNNVAVVDALPAGLEIETPRLDSDAAQAVCYGQDTGNRAEFRDDRVILFVSAGATPRTFGYTLRAITAGSFAGPAIEASCMYDGRFASVSAGRPVEVSR
jgi:hypothetical protein